MKVRVVLRLIMREAIPQLPHTSSWHGVENFKVHRFYTYHLLQHSKTLHSGHRMYLRVSYGSRNKHQNFP
jgi:hypothetical protein